MLFHKQLTLCKCSFRLFVTLMNRIRRSFMFSIVLLLDGNTLVITKQKQRISYTIKAALGRPI